MAGELHLGDLGSRGLKIIGTGKTAGLGGRLSGLGDFNGDGVADFVLSGVVTGNSGTAYVIYGGAGNLAPIDVNALSPDRGFRVTGLPASYGMTVAGGGDIDGDGYDDLVLGTLSDPVDFTTYAGRAHVIWGRGDAPSGFDLAQLSPADGYSIFDSTPNADDNGDGPRIGDTVASVGDVNGDGIGDFAVTAPLDSTYAEWSGRTYVLYGGQRPGAAVDVDRLRPDQGFTLDGTAFEARAGATVAGLGDVNHDGLDDLIVTSSVDQTTAYVIFGKLGGVANLKLPKLTPDQGFVIKSEPNYFISSHVAGAGDVNGDGYDDIILASGTGHNKDYIVFGKAGGFGTVDLRTLAAPDGFTITSHGIGIGGNVTGPGDVNGDGYDDLVVFAPASTGAMGYVIYGHGGAFGTIDIDALTPDAGYVIVSDDRGDMAGLSLSAAGDVNDDGVDDFLIGASSGPKSGAAYLIYGQTPDEAVTRTGTDASQRLAGGAFDDRLSGLGGDDILYGNAGADQLNGGDGNDLLNGGAGADRMTGGLGDDTYRVDSTGDKVKETAGAGYDTVEATLDWTLGKNSEALLLRAGAAISGKGNQLDNVLTGNANANILNGMAGDDVLIGGGGSDQLTGGSGRDVFRFDGATVARVVADADRVTDFAHAEDKLDLSRVDAKAGSGGVDPFTFVGTAAFTRHAGELRYEFAGKTTIVSGDTDGDGVGDVFVQLKGRVALDAGDFALAHGQSPESANLAAGTGWHSFAPLPAHASLDTMHPLALA